MNQKITTKVLSKFGQNKKGLKFIGSSSALMGTHNAKTDSCYPVFVLTQASGKAALEQTSSLFFEMLKNRFIYFIVL